VPVCACVCVRVRARVRVRVRVHARIQVRVRLDVRVHARALDSRAQFSVALVSRWLVVGRWPGCVTLKRTTEMSSLPRCSVQLARAGSCPALVAYLLKLPHMSPV